jgi:hypothetical protein
MSKEKAIAMSEEGLAQWKYHLNKKKIYNHQNLINAVFVVEASQQESGEHPIHESRFSKLIKYRRIKFAVHFFACKASRKLLFSY